MKVMFTSGPAYGHLYPLMPLALAILLSFALGPLVLLLRRWRRPLAATKEV